MKYARKLHIYFVQYFHYNSDWFSVQIYYVQTFLHCPPAGVECATIRFAIITGYYTT